MKLLLALLLGWVCGVTTGVVLDHDRRFRQALAEDNPWLQHGLGFRFNGLDDEADADAMEASQR